MSQHTILLVDDDTNILTTLGMRLESLGYQVLTAEDGPTAVTLTISREPDLVLLDLRLPGMDGLEVLEEIRSKVPDTQVVLLTAQGSVETAVEAMRLGAYDYLEKPIDSNRLRLVLERALSQRNIQQEVGRLKSTLKEMGRFGHLIGQSEPMRQLYELMEQVAGTAATVLVTGESGTGKELIAQTVHDLSDRGQGPFIAVNCSAIMATLWESETFGYEKGAFTGAHKRHQGFLEQANGGTLFLDEVGEMSLESQAKFLRVLETRRVTRVGGSSEVPLDMRVVAATNRDLEKAVADGEFREDLYYRLNVFVLHAPPLRDRRGDIPLLAGSFLKDFSDAYGKEIDDFSEGCLARLKAHSWPGNVRELRNVIERAVILTRENEVTESQLPDGLTDGQSEGGSPADFGEGMTIQKMERALIFDTLERNGGNKTRAARALGISLKTLHNKLGRYRQEGEEAQSEVADGG